jgi:hypothetical protein
MGWENFFQEPFSKLCAKYDVDVNHRQLNLSKETFSAVDHSVALVARHPEDPKQVLVFLAANRIQALTGLARKLPHYGKYSYLVFSGSEPKNLRKGQWPVTDSPLSVTFQDSESSQNLVPLPQQKALMDRGLFFPEERKKRYKP